MNHNTRYFGMIIFKLALQAAGYIRSPTQGVALGWYKLAFRPYPCQLPLSKGWRKNVPFQGLMPGKAESRELRINNFPAGRMQKMDIMDK